MTAVLKLAHEIGVSEETVMVAYETEVARMGSAAAVTQFLDLLAAKHLKAAMLARQRAGDTPRSGPTDP
jgi:hypothetical protein